MILKFENSNDFRYDETCRKKKKATKIFLVDVIEFIIIRDNNRATKLIFVKFFDNSDSDIFLENFDIATKIILFLLNLIKFLDDDLFKNLLRYNVIEKNSFMSDSIVQIVRTFFKKFYVSIEIVAHNNRNNNDINEIDFENINNRKIDKLNNKRKRNVIELRVYYNDNKQKIDNKIDK